MQSEANLSHIWQQLVALFPARLHAGYLFKAMSGVTYNADVDRVSNFQQSKPYQAAESITRELPAQVLEALYAKACINYEKVSDAMRLFVIINVTVPVTMLAFLAEVVDFDFIGFTATLFNDSKIAMAVTFFGLFLAVTAFVGHQYAAALSARDLRNFMRLKLAERGISS